MFSERVSVRGIAEWRLVNINISTSCEYVKSVRKVTNCSVAHIGKPPYSLSWTSLLFSLEFSTAWLEHCSVSEHINCLVEHPVRWHSACARFVHCRFERSTIIAFPNFVHYNYILSIAFPNFVHYNYILSIAFPNFVHYNYRLSIAFPYFVHYNYILSIPFPHLPTAILNILSMAFLTYPLYFLNIWLSSFC